MRIVERRRPITLIFRTRHLLYTIAVNSVGVGLVRHFSTHASSLTVLLAGLATVLFQIVRSYLAGSVYAYSADASGVELTTFQTIMS